MHLEVRRLSTKVMRALSVKHLLHRWTGSRVLSKKEPVQPVLVPVFRNAVIGILVGLSAFSARAESAEDPVTVTIQPYHLNEPLGSTFNGISEEKAVLTNPFFTAENSNLIALYRLLGKAVLRFGGVSGDHMTWNPNGKGMVLNVVSPPDIQRLAGFLDATNWQVIYPLNLGTGTSAEAASEAAYVSAALGDHLLGFAIGNEPGLYHSDGLRPASYDVSDYVEEWKTFADAILAETPSAQLIGPDDGNYLAGLASAHRHNLSLLTDHDYRYAGVGGGNEASMLFTPNTFFDDDMLPQVDSEATAAGIPWRMDEANAFYELPTPANIFAQALWAIDFEFLLASNQASGVNFHSLPGEAPVNAVNNAVTSVNPIYYAMKLFSMAARGTLQNAVASSQSATFSPYAVGGSNGATYVILNNKDPNNAVEASITFLQPVASATSMFLTAPSLTATSGVKLGGVSIATDGNWPSPETHEVSVSDGVATVTVPPGSAAFVEALPVTTSFAIGYDGLCAESLQATSDGPFLLAQGTSDSPFLLAQEKCNSTSPSQQFAFVPSPDGFYYIVPQNSDLCLSWKGLKADVLQTGCAQSSTQKWKVKLTSSGAHYIESANGAYCLNVKNNLTVLGGPIETYTCDGQANEQFTLNHPPIAPLQTTKTTVEVSYDSLCMDRLNSQQSVGHYIIQHPCSGAATQSWGFSSTVDGYYIIQSNATNELCLDGTTTNAAVIQNTCTGTTGQKWQLVGNSDKTYTLKGDGTQMCLGIANASTAAYSRFTVSPCNGGADQQLKFATPPPLLPTQ
jgi:hypothetical protein